MQTQQKAYAFSLQVWISNVTGKKQLRAEIANPALLLYSFIVPPITV